MTPPPSLPSSVTTRFPALLSPPSQLRPLPSSSNSNSSCLAVLAPEPAIFDFKYFGFIFVNVNSFLYKDEVEREILGSNPSLRRSSTTRNSFYFIGTITVPLLGLSGGYLLEDF
ncbi:hypothetical protein CFP56_008581 [Quercus suber]|uniref:Uncharacterized protein n=1 Tax=Quercus suber TaxID=58331 RepID=A0AAW0L3Y2_QUESU